MTTAAHHSMWGNSVKFPYDKQLQYLQADGIAYIDTGLKMMSGYEMSIRFQFLQNTSENLSAGGYYYNNTHALRMYWRGGSTDWRYQFPTNSATIIATSSQVAFGDVHEIVIGGTSVTLDGITASTAAQSAFTSNYNIHLFGSSSYNPGDGGSKHELQSASSKMRVYSATWKKDGVVVRDFIPVRIGTVGYMYDRANPTESPNGDGFYSKQGTGAFVLGPDDSTSRGGA